MIVTVPNALRERNCRASRNDGEIINSDHRFWFTPFTIAKVLTVADFKIEDLYMVRHKPLKNNKVNLKAWKRRCLQSRHPFFRDTVVVTASLERGT